MNMNVSLTEELVGYVKAKVETGRYTSSSEVVREALRLMEAKDLEEAEKLNWLRDAVQKGIDSGIVGPLDVEDVRTRGRRRLAALKG